jgi:carbonic anhydrase/acetyltransferase-like protein (isoleucine patch superfamily)
MVRWFLAQQKLVIPGTTIPENSLVLGVPGKVAREPSKENLEMTARTAANYQRNRDRYLKDLREVK